MTFGALALALAAVAALAAGALAKPGNGQGKGLGKTDRALVAKAEATGAKTVPLVIATQPGGAAAVAGTLSGIGASIVEQNDQFGYVIADVPTGKAVAAAKAAGILAANVDKPVPAVIPDPDGRGGTPGNGSAQPPANLAAQNPYMPTYRIGAPQFVAAHPTYDGRGVKVGIVDTGVDLDRPELQSALDLNGKPVVKIYDWRTTTQPRLSDGANGDPTWVPITAVALNGDGQNITTAAGKYQLPVELKSTTHPLKFGLFVEGDPRLGGELGSDVNRDGDTRDTFGVLEDMSTRTVWVDVNGNQNFIDDKPMTDYRVKQDVNHFGKDNNGTKDVVETVPFVVQTTNAGTFVNIGIVSGGHGTHVAGTVAGKGFFGGKFDGVAPNAQLAVARVCLFITGCFTSDQVSAFNYLITVAKVDLIQMSIGGLPALNDDANDAEAQIVDNMTKTSGVQFFFSNGNSGPGANTVGSPATADAAIGSGAYQSRDTWNANYGNDVPKDDTLWAFSSRGPREDGGLKPNVVSPGSELSTWPAWNMSENPFAGGLGSRVYALPPGYEMIQGTSMASPMSAGAGALLLSAALQNGFRATPQQLQKSFFSSAKYLSGYQAYEQGNGLTQVGGAWDVLKTKPLTPSITSTATVNTKISQLIAPYEGVGIYEREGWKAGDSGDRSITFTRGDSIGSGTYAVSWLGNDGTFSSPATLTIPANGSATLAVHIGPVAAGIHSAILRLDDTSSAGYEYETLNTVVAADQFSSPSYQVTGTGTPDRADKKAFFVNVQPGTPVLQLNENVTGGRTRLDVVDPFGVPYTLAAPCGCALDYTTAPGSKSLSIENPMAGVWEIDVEASRAAPTAVSNASFTASELGVTISPSSWTIDPSTVGQTYTKQFTFTNKFGSFTGAATGTDLGSAFAARPTATNPTGPNDPTQEFKIAVPSGATKLHVAIGNPAEPNTDLDLYVFDPSGNLVGQSAGSSANESVNIANPVAGTYTAVVDNFMVGGTGTTQYDYTDVYSLPGLGSVTTNDTPATHAPGSSWSATATVKPLGAAGAGRFLQGFVTVTSGGATVGRAEVDLR
ncbi:MAG TPA: S8 family serine peptidase [Gaiellaceae bacterium]|nr:S8 family serine peptidase [Gaiellaceae bacterium]